MAGSNRVKHPLFFVALLGALLTVIGAIINWVECHRDLQKGQDDMTIAVRILKICLGVLVPVLSILAHLRRSRQLYAVAFACVVASMTTLVEIAALDVFRLQKIGTVALGSGWHARVAGEVIQLIGIPMSIAPVLKGIRINMLALIVTGVAALFWFVAGVMTASKVKDKYTEIQYSSFSTYTTTLSFLFAAWAVIAGLRRSISLSVGLCILALYNWQSVIAECVLAFHTRGGTRVIAGADIISSLAIVIFVAWVSFDFSRQKVPDRIKDVDDGYLPVK